LELALGPEARGHEEARGRQRARAHDDLARRGDGDVVVVPRASRADADDAGGRRHISTFVRLVLIIERKPKRGRVRPKVEVRQRADLVGEKGRR